MKQFWKDMGIAGIMGILLPGCLLGLAVSRGDEAPAVPEQTLPMASAAEQDTSVSTLITVLSDDGVPKEMELNDYLTGVVLAEMPVSFEPEAQKAQAVVARTYTIRAKEGKSKHDNAAVCTDSGCCQAYISETEYLERGGRQEEIDKMRQAVEQTAGQVLTYEGELIEATYFSCSGGITEDAVDVWGTDVPYLRATPSPGEEHAAHYTDTVVFSGEEFASALSIKPKGTPKGWFGPVTYTAGGGVASLTICGIEFEGTTLRKLLGLRSTAFTVTAGEDSITIITRGYGHRVGMSQYGADAMAVSGSDYTQILAHYYQGTVLTQWPD